MATLWSQSARAVSCRSLSEAGTDRWKVQPGHFPMHCTLGVAQYASKAFLGDLAQEAEHNLLRSVTKQYPKSNLRFERYSSSIIRTHIPHDTSGLFSVFVVSRTMFNLPHWWKVKTLNILATYGAVCFWNHRRVKFPAMKCWRGLWHIEMACAEYQSDACPNQCCTYVLTGSSDNAPMSRECHTQARQKKIMKLLIFSLLYRDTSGQWAYQRCSSFKPLQEELVSGQLSITSVPWKRVWVLAGHWYRDPFWQLERMVLTNKGKNTQSNKSPHYFPSRNSSTGALLWGKLLSLGARFDVLSFCPHEEFPVDYDSTWAKSRKPWEAETWAPLSCFWLRMSSPHLAP